jgi:transposase-like protein
VAPRGPSHPRYDEALGAFLAGRQPAAIAREMGIGERTIRNWRHGYDWDAQRERAASIVAQELPGAVAAGVLAAAGEGARDRATVADHRTRAQLGDFRRLRRKLRALVEACDSEIGGQRLADAFRKLQDGERLALGIAPPTGDRPAPPPPIIPGQGSVDQPAPVAVASPEPAARTDPRDPKESLRLYREGLG